MSDACLSHATCAVFNSEAADEAVAEEAFVEEVIVDKAAYEVKEKEEHRSANLIPYIQHHHKRLMVLCSWK